MTYIEQQVPAAPQFKAFSSFGYGAIAVVFGAFGLWASFAPLNGAVVAPATMTVQGDTKPVQHLEGGIVRDILVHDAQTVAEGQVLLRLDPVQAQANLDLLHKQLDVGLILNARLVAEREEKNELQLGAEIEARRNVPETATAIADQRAQLADYATARRSEAELAENRTEQANQEIASRQFKLASDEKLLKSLQSEIQQLTPLFEKKFVTAVRMRGVERDRDRVESDIEQGRAEIRKLEKSRDETRLLLEQSQQKQHDAIEQQLSETRARISDLREKVAIARDVLTRLEVRAPRAGVVQGLKVHAAGAVIRPGEEIAEIVPLGDGLILSARVSPANIQDVVVNQRAEVRFSSFGRSLPPIFGHVMTVGADTQLDETTREPFYLVRLRIEPKGVPPEIASKLTPGIPADVLILTEARTFAQYLLKPIEDRFAKAFREK